jgi:uncharacterized membrane protein
MKPLSRIRTHLEASFWFVPALILLCSLGAAVALVEAESLAAWDPAQWSPRLFGAGASGSRAMLSAIGTSMITVAGVVFSITIVALSLTSTQYSPRVLRNFMRDRPTQVVLGVFVGIFAYCLVVLRTIRGGDEGEFIPSLAVLGGMAYALAGIAFLVFFIHHVALSIQASSILARIAADTMEAMDRMFPQGLGTAPESEEPPPELPASWTEVAAHKSGYVVAVNGDALLELAGEWGRVLRLEAQVGEFIADGSPVACAAGASPLDQGQQDRLLDCVELGKQRTVEQDVGFGLQQLVDVALRALSPGVNDPATACMCIDQLSGLLAQLGRRSIPGPLRMKEGKLHLVLRTPDFGTWLKLALLPIAMHARGDLSVLQRLVSAMELLAETVQQWPERREAMVPVATQLQRALNALPARKIARPLHGRLRAMQRRLQSSNFPPSTLPAPPAA